jgi:hypothetical protein
MKRSLCDYGAAFAKILVPLRERKGVTQEQLADRSKVPLRTIRLYERGTRRGGPIYHSSRHDRDRSGRRSGEWRAGAAAAGGRAMSCPQRE